MDGYGNYVQALVRNSTPVDVYFVFRRKDLAVLSEKDFSEIANNFLINGQKFFDVFNNERIDLNSIDSLSLEENLLENIISNLTQKLPMKPRLARLLWNNDEENVSTDIRYDNIITYKALPKGTVSFTLKKGFQCKIIYLDSNKNYQSLDSWIQAVDEDIEITYTIQNYAYITFSDLTEVATGTHLFNEYFSNFYYLPVEKNVEKNNNGLFHISIDDVEYCFTNLKNNYNTYNSLFDEPLFNFLQQMHEKYGVCISLYCYNLTNLNTIGDKFKNDFISNSNWLKIGFHSPETGSLQNVSIEDCISYYNTFIENITRIASINNIDRIPRLNYYYATTDQLSALKDLQGGILGLLTADSNIQVPYLSSYQQEFLQNNNFLIDITKKLYYWATNFRIDWFVNNGQYADTTPTAKLEEIYNDDSTINKYSNLFVFTHEWLLYRNSQFNSQVQNYFEDCCKFAKNYKLNMTFPQNTITPLNF